MLIIPWRYIKIWFICDVVPILYMPILDLILNQLQKGELDIEKLIYIGKLI